MAYDVNKLATVGQLKTLAQAAKTAIGDAIAALPGEMFLDQLGTKFVPSFSFSTETYPGATNPSLEGKPVLVLAVKGVDNTTPSDASKQTISYSFLDMAALVDDYTVKAGDSTKILTIAGREIEIKISAVANNAITVQNDGLHVNISAKADKVSGATANNVSALDANGNLIDSGIAKDNILQVANVALDTEFAEMINEVFA
ncbi:MAG: hypothetical protein IJQ08_08655 [Synergistaceae bacterium]|nr:hypothetical protein [Synergistaceae bacterium]